MQLFSYDPLTGAFAGAVVADESPLEPGVWLWPANTTDAEPPAAGPGQFPVYRAGEWHVVPDHRGEIWFDAQGEAVRVAGLGDPADNGLRPSAPPPGVAALKARAAEQRYQLEIGGLAWKQYRVGTDRESQQKLSTAYLVAVQQPAFVIPAWKMLDGTFVALTNADVVDLGKAVLALVQTAFHAEKLVCEQIDAGRVKTFAEVDAFFIHDAG